MPPKLPDGDAGYLAQQQIKEAREAMQQAINRGAQQAKTYEARIANQLETINRVQGLLVDANREIDRLRGQATGLTNRLNAMEEGR